MILKVVGLVAMVLGVLLANYGGVAAKSEDSMGLIFVGAILMFSGLGAIAIGGAL